MTLPLVPSPVRIITGDGTLRIANGSGIALNSPELTPIARQFIDDVRIDAGIALSMTARPDAAPDITIGLDSEDLATVPPAGGVRADGKPAAEADERHGITISAEGARVWGSTVEGVHRGLTSLRQLIAAAARGGEAKLPALTIVDGPRFAWRGLSVDVARTFHGPDTLRRVIDMCALHKVNVLHLHLTDDQGWRIEVPSRPRLTGIGAAGALGGRPGGFYSPAQVAELVEYATARFVTVVPEIDLPGHTGAVFRAYPELAPADGMSRDVAPGLAIGTLDPQREQTWSFVGAVLDAVIPQFPHSAYLHLGGDEAFGMADDAHAAFVERAVEFVRDRGRLALGWQEIARATIGPQEIVQYWIDPRETAALMDNPALNEMIPAEAPPLISEHMAKAEHDLPRALGRGAKILVSPMSRLYFDHPHAGRSTVAAQEAMRARVGLPAYPPMSLRQGVEWDPADDSPGVVGDEQIAGVEAAIWCETIATREELEFMLLPRLGGLAEKGWSARGVTEWGDYADRLAAQSVLWAARGWTWFASDAVAWAVTAGARQEPD